MPDSKFFTFLCQTTTFFFFRFLDPPYFWAEGLNFFGDFTKFFAEKKLTGLVPPRDPNLLISPNLKCDCSLKPSGLLKNGVWRGPEKFLGGVDLTQSYFYPKNRGDPFFNNFWPFSPILAKTSNLVETAP